MTCQIKKYSLISQPEGKSFMAIYLDQDQNYHTVFLTSYSKDDTIIYVNNNDQKEFDHYFVDEPKELQDIVEKLKFFDYDIPINEMGITVYKEDNGGSNNE